MSNDLPTPADAQDDAWERIARHLAGEDGPEEREALRAELSAHPERGALLAALDGAVASAAEPLLPPERVELALQRVMARRDEPVHAPAPAPVRDAGTRVIPLRTPRRRPAWLAAAAMVLLALGGAFLWRQLSPARAAVEYVTGVGETEQIRLADGSLVQLAPLSRLFVGADYGRGRRELRLDGQAFITVTHDAEQPFVVLTPRAEVEDLGTAFTVSADSAATDVVVTEGVVAVRPSGGGPRTVVRAGGRAHIEADGQVAAGPAPDPAGEATAWTQGRLVFRDTPLAELADEFQRWYGLTLVITDPALARRPVTATLPTASAAEALQVLAAAAGVRVDQRGDTVSIVALP
jgi:transmembrane sensor